VESASLAKNSGYYYLHTDHLGTPILATDKTGVVTWKAVSDAFGETKVLPPSRITMNLRFPGQYFDAESGSHYNLHRDYNLQTGRYLQSDPIGLQGGINIYGYAGKNPFVFIDADGKNPAGAAAAAIAIGRFVVGRFGRIAGGRKKPSEPSIPLPPIPTPPEGKSETEPHDWSHNPGDDCDGKCKPCLPPVGTICYKGPHTTHSHSGLNPHYHFFEMNQDSTCTCRWNKAKNNAPKVSAHILLGIPECPFEKW